MNLIGFVEGVEDGNDDGERRWRARMWKRTELAFVLVMRVYDKMERFKDCCADAANNLLLNFVGSRFEGVSLTMSCTVSKKPCAA